jgi:hypothetical protein
MPQHHGGGSRVALRATISEAVDDEIRALAGRTGKTINDTVSLLLIRGLAMSALEEPREAAADGE